MRTVCSFTESWYSNPAYFNASQDAAGNYVLTVRGAGEQCGQKIIIPRQTMQNLSDDLHYEFHNGSGG